MPSPPPFFREKLMVVYSSISLEDGDGFCREGDQFLLNYLAVR
jgi:hypothetical protein